MKEPLFVKKQRLFSGDGVDKGQENCYNNLNLI